MKIKNGNKSFLIFDGGVKLKRKIKLTKDPKEKKNEDQNWNKK